MRKFLIASHRLMADGLKDTVCFFTGKSNIESLSLYMNENSMTKEFDEFSSKIQEDDEVIIFTDIMSGSVNQAFCSLISENVHIVTGVNLPVILELVCYPENQPINQSVIQKIVENARNQIMYVNSFSQEEDDDDE